MGFRSDIASSHAVHRIYAKPYRRRTTAHGCLSSAERDGPVGTGLGKPTKSTADPAERGDAEVIDGHYNLAGRDKKPSGGSDGGINFTSNLPRLKSRVRIPCPALNLNDFAASIGGFLFWVRPRYGIPSLL